MALEEADLARNANFVHSLFSLPLKLANDNQDRPEMVNSKGVVEDSLMGPWLYHSLASRDFGR